MKGVERADEEIVGKKIAEGNEGEYGEECMACFRGIGRAGGDYFYAPRGALNAPRTPYLENVNKEDA